MCRSNQELKEKLYSFTLADEETDKLAFLRTLCRQMANTVCKADAVSTEYCSGVILSLIFSGHPVYCRPISTNLVLEN